MSDVEVRFDYDWKKLKGITFDVDANLYNYNKMMYPRLHRWGRYVRFLMHLTAARKKIRREGKQENFRKRQAELVAELTGKSVEEMSAKIDKVLYYGWNEDFKTVKPYKGVTDVIERCVRNDIKIAVVTDYPPMKKLEYMGLLDYPWAKIVECEELGLLKPEPEGFKTALEAMGLQDEPENVLHIGDHPRYDIDGAQQMGMMGAWLSKKIRFTKLPWGHEDTENRGPDIIFKKWTDLDAKLAELTGWK